MIESVNFTGSFFMRVIKPSKDKWQEYNFTSHLGMYASDEFYLLSYERVVNILIERIDQGTDRIDQVSAPLLFLMRHSMELGYKINISFLAQYGEELTDQERKVISSKHHLQTLHDLMVKKFKKAAIELGLTSDITKSFNEYEAKTKLAMTKFEELDHGSFSFRYESDAEGNKVFPHELKINLLDLYESYDAAMTLLKYMDAVLKPATDYADMKKEELEKYVRGRNEVYLRRLLLTCSPPLLSSSR